MGLSKKEIIQAVWSKIKGILGTNDISEIGDGTVTGAISSINSNLFDKVYPVGSIYLSTKSTNPSFLFGGTWVAWGSGRVPVGVNADNNNFNTVEKLGGTVSNTYNIDHVHQVGQNITNTNTVSGEGVVAWGSNYTGASNKPNISVSTLQPYITCYMWKRSA